MGEGKGLSANLFSDGDCVRRAVGGPFGEGDGELALDGNGDAHQGRGTKHYQRLHDENSSVSLGGDSVPWGGG